METTARTFRSLEEALRYQLERHKEYLLGGTEPHARFDRWGLSDSDLSAVNLTMASMTFTDFRRANLDCTNLTRADASGSNFTRASLRNAVAQDTNLSYATLRLADLTDANLAGANLSEADLTDANLTRARLTDCTFRHTKGIVAALQFDPRGYNLVAWVREGDLWVNAGCHSLPIDIAETHWEGAGYPDPDRGILYQMALDIIRETFEYKKRYTKDIILA